MSLKPSNNPYEKTLYEIVKRCDMAYQCEAMYCDLLNKITKVVEDDTLSDTQRIAEINRLLPHTKLS